LKIVVHCSRAASWPRVQKLKKEKSRVNLLSSLRAVSKVNHEVVEVRGENKIIKRRTVIKT
jgi:hypothetical protein